MNYSRFYRVGLCFFLLMSCICFLQLSASATNIYYTGFENFTPTNWQGWSASNGEWEAGVPTSGPNSSHEGVKCIATALAGNYQTLRESRLVSPAMNLPILTSRQGITLTFWQWFSFGGIGGQFGDNPSTGCVQVQEWTGTAWGDWTTVSDTFSGNSGGLKYTCYISDLSTYAGKRIRVGFLHHAGYVASSGWYLDEVSVDVDVINELPLNQTITFENFSDTDTHGWFASNGVWEFGSPTSGPNSSHEGMKGAATVLAGNYPAQHESRLVSPAINLPALNYGQEVTLTFWQWYSFAGPGGQFGSNPSTGNVQVQEWSGIAWSDWTTLGDTYVSDSGGWQYVGSNFPPVDLSAYAGKHIRIGFLQHGGYYAGIGWYLDELTIIAPSSAILVTDVSLNKTILSLDMGTSETLIAIITPSDASNKAVVWKSSNTDVTTVDEIGKVTAVSLGTCTITATTVDGGFKATCQVDVGTQVTGVNLNKTTLSLDKGASETLIATVNPSDATNKAVTWSSDNTSIASVDTSGKVTAIGNGNCTITVTTTDGEKTASCQVTVATPVTSVSLNKATLFLNYGDSETLLATVNPSDASNKEVAWTSSNNSVATVDSNGKVTSVNGGSCIITVTTDDGVKTATCQVTVGTPVISVSLNITSILLDNGAYETLVAKINPTDATNKAVTWSSSDTDVATVDSNGKVTAISDGSCIITVTTVDGGKTAACSVNVNSTFYFTSPTVADTCDSFSNVINIGGKCSSSITKVTWQIDSKRKGSCKISKGAWSASKIKLVMGENLITVTGKTKDKQTYADTMLVNYIDITEPEVKISSPSANPTYKTTKAEIAVSGSVKESETVAKVTWVNSATGASGVCTGTKSWKTLNIALNLGNNEISITAEDSSGNTGTETITINRIDKTKPKVVITTPTKKSSLKLNDQNVTLGGTASDDIEVAKIEWLNKSTGASGVCTGTTAWNSGAIPLKPGKNSILITATDTSGNKATDSISITNMLIF